MIAASVPMLWHLVTVLLLLSAHGMTVMLAKRRIATLQAALVAKRVLLKQPNAVVGRQHMAVGDTISVKTSDGQEIVHIHAFSAADIEVRSFV